MPGWLRGMREGCAGWPQGMQDEDARDGRGGCGKDEDARGGCGGCGMRMRGMAAGDAGWGAG